MESPTRRYISENEEVLALPGSNELPYVDVSSFELAKSHFRKQVRATWIGWRHLLRSWLRDRAAFDRLAQLRDSRKGRPALVLGNGPSQGYLTTDVVQAFKRRGDIICVNRWFENEDLVTVPPDYVTLSDPYDAGIGDSPRPGHARMRELLLQETGIIIFCPLEWLPHYRREFGDRCIGFNDWEVRWLRNFNPMLPRGYVSMTLFKALAMAMYMGYDEIYVLGMDNTYPRNLYCGPDRRVFSRRMHAGADDYIEYEDTDVAHMLFQLYLLFEDLNHFRAKAGGRIYNLDPYSLSDAFPKAATIEHGQAVLAGSIVEKVRS